VKRAPAAAKINLSLVVGPLRDAGKHEVVTVYQRVALSDRIAVERSPELSVAGFAGDTLVRRGSRNGSLRPRD
jgi:4-diphosphocytidyl-2C-methyl-D-erythritol kinase